MSAMIQSSRLRELTPSDAFLISDTNSDVDNTEKNHQSLSFRAARPRLEKATIFVSSPWQDDIAVDQRTLSLHPSLPDEDTNISVEYDPLLIKQYIDGKSYEYEQGTSPHQTVVDLDDETEQSSNLVRVKSSEPGNQRFGEENSDDIIDKRAPVSMLRMGRSEKNSNALGVLRLGSSDHGMLRMGSSGENKRGSVSMLRMGRSSTDKRDALNMLRMGRSSVDKRDALNMLRMGRSEIGKKAFSMLRLGRSFYEDGDKGAVSAVLVGGGSVNGMQEDQRTISRPTMERGYDKIAEAKQTVASSKIENGAEEELNELKRAVRMLRLGRNFSKNENQADDMIGKTQYVDNEEKGSIYKTA